MAMPLLIIASTLIIYSSPSLALLISNQRHQPRFQTARVASRAATRADDYETSAENWWRVHRIDRLKSVSESADVQNPLLLEGHIHPTYFVKDGEAVLKTVIFDSLAAASEKPIAFARSGPKERLFFNPSQVTAAIVTCGGICPGLNTVVRELVFCLEKQYGVGTVWGVPGGYRGFLKPEAWKPLTAQVVDQWHTLGGTALGTSRGGHDTSAIVDALAAKGVNQVYVVGGDGTLRGASLVAQEAKKRGLVLSVVGVPKTVDNDIPIIDKSFGFETAVEEAQRAIDSVNVEARSFPFGVGVVQLMGRNSGFIALHACLGSRDVDCVLVPEVDFELDGDNGLFSYLERRLLEKGYVNVVVAEGAGQSHVAAGAHLEEEDATGGSLKRSKRNARGQAVLDDIGVWLCDAIQEHFSDHPSIAPSLKYVNPTYMVRSVKANAADNVYCTALAHGAVHGAMGGFTNFMVGPVNSHHAMIPLGLIFARTNVVSITDEVWARAIFSTGQPNFDGAADIGECDVSTDTAYGGCTIDLERLSPGIGG